MNKVNIPIKIAAWIMIVSGITSFILSGVFMMGQLLVMYSGQIDIYPLAFFSSFFLIPSSFFLLRRKRWAWHASVYSLLLLIFITWLWGGMDECADRLECALGRKILFSSYIVPLIFLFLGRKNYRKTASLEESKISNHDPKGEAIISSVLGIIGVTLNMILYFTEIILEVLGIIGFIVFCFIVPLIALFGLIFGIMGLKSTKRNFAIAGIALCIIGLVAPILYFVFY